MAAEGREFAGLRPFDVFNVGEEVQTSGEWKPTALVSRYVVSNLRSCYTRGPLFKFMLYYPALILLVHPVPWYHHDWILMLHLNTMELSYHNLQPAGPGRKEHPVMLG
jgi:hypothetical protein